MISVVPMKTLIVGFHIGKFGCYKATLPKNSPSQPFLVLIFEFGALRIGIKNST